MALRDAAVGADQEARAERSIGQGARGARAARQEVQGRRRGAPEPGSVRGV